MISLFDTDDTYSYVQFQIFDLYYIYLMIGDYSNIKVRSLSRIGLF